MRCQKLSSVILSNFEFDIDLTDNLKAIKQQQQGNYSLRRPPKQIIPQA